MSAKLFSKKKPDGRVLVVEDDAMLSGVLAESLKAEKFKVMVVPDGAQVLEETGKFLPDIILLDLVLPGIDGFELLRSLKAETKTAKIPVVVLSNLSQVADVKAVKALGADQYFLKANTSIETIIQYIKDRFKK